VSSEPVKVVKTGTGCRPQRQRTRFGLVLSCPGREPDLPIVARKRLIPVEPRGRTLLLFSSREGGPLGHNVPYGRMDPFDPEILSLAKGTGP